MRNSSRGFCIFYDWFEAFEKLSMPDVARLVLAIGRYYRDGSDGFDGVSKSARAVAAVIRGQLERILKRKKKITATSKGEGDIGGGDYKTETQTKTETETEAEAETETETSSSKTGAKQNSHKDPDGVGEQDSLEGALGGGTCDDIDFSFSSGQTLGVPTLKEVEDYVRERGLDYINPQYFYEYNERRAWTINGEPIRDWQSIINIWDAKRHPPVTVGEEKRRYGNFDVDDAFSRALKRSYGDLG